MPEFVHLHLHSEFSLLDGLGKLDHYAARGLYPEAHLVADDTQDRDRDFVPDVDGLYGTTRENEHAASFRPGKAGTHNRRRRRRASARGSMKANRS